MQNDVEKMTPDEHVERHWIPAFAGTTEIE
jgi:hypothetical protein